MRKPIVRFSENVILMMGLAAAIMVAALGHSGVGIGKEISGYPTARIGYVVATLLALWSLRSLGVSMMVTPTSITRKTLFGEYRIFWNEMERVEIGPSCFWLVFHGAGKRIWMRRPRASVSSYFRDMEANDGGEEYEDPVLSQILEIVEEQGIPTTGGWLTAFRASKA